MRRLIVRAWRDTLVSRGISAFSPLRLVVPWLLASGAVVVAMWLIRGPSEAMTEAVDIAIYVFAGGGVVFVATFLWHLWLAPYRVLNERLDKIAHAHEQPKPLDEEAARRSDLNIKRDTALREMRALEHCISARAQRNADPPELRRIGEYDYEYIALRDKYDNWVPSTLEEQGMLHWVRQIIAVLKYNKFDEAERTIERAMNRKKWDSQGREP